MKLTLSVIKADIGSIGGHIAPSKRLRETVEAYIRERASGLILDHYISSTGDDIAILAWCLPDRMALPWHFFTQLPTGLDALFAGAELLSRFRLVEFLARGFLVGGHDAVVTHALLTGERAPYSQRCSIFAGYAAIRTASPFPLLPT